MESKSNGYQLLETSGGYNYDVSYDPDTGDDVIVVDGLDTSTIHLTKSDIQIMLEMLE